jgi:hypothetical protein
MSGKLAARATAAWADAGLERLTLHECRHTYASLLMAAGNTLKELMEFMGHADQQMVNRYVKLLPQPGEDDAAERLNAYCDGRANVTDDLSPEPIRAQPARRRADQRRDAAPAYRWSHPHWSPPRPAQGAVPTAPSIPTREQGGS